MQGELAAREDWKSEGMACAVRLLRQPRYNVSMRRGIERHEKNGIDYKAFVNDVHSPCLDVSGPHGRISRKKSSLRRQFAVRFYSFGVDSGRSGKRRPEWRWDSGYSRHPGSRRTGLRFKQSR